MAAASSPTTAIAGLLHVHSSRYVWSTLAISAEGSNAPPLTLEPATDSKAPSASTFTLEPAPADSLDATPSPLLTFRDSAGHYVASADGVALSLVPFYSASSCAWRLVDDHYLQCASSDSFLACSVDHGVTLSRTRDDAHCRFLLCPPRIEGWLQKKASSGLLHSYQKRYFRFEAGLLSYWHSDTDAKEDGHGHTHAKPAGTFLWSNVVSVAQSHASPLRFDVEIKSTDAHGHALAATRKLELQAHDVAEVAAWVAAIRGPHVESVVKAGRLSAAALHPSQPSSQNASSSRNNSRRGSLEQSTTSTEHQHLPPKHAAVPQAVAIEEGVGSEVAASASAATAVDAGAMSPTSALVFGVTESPLAAAIKAAEHQEEQKAREVAHSVHADEKLVEDAAQREADAALALQQEAALHQSIAHTDGVERASMHRSESTKIVDAADAAAEYKAAAEARSQLAGAGGVDSCVSPGTIALEDASRVDQPEAAESHAAAEAATLATREAAEQRRQQQLLQAAESTQPASSQPSVDQHLQDDVAARAAEEQRVAAVAAAVAEERAKHAAIVQQQHADTLVAAASSAPAHSPSPEAAQVEADRQRELERIAAQEKAGAELQAAQEAEMLRVKRQQAEEEQARELQASRDAEAAKVAEAEREEIIRKRLEADEQEAKQAAKEREQRAQAEAEQLAAIAAQQKREAEEAAAAAAAAAEAEKAREQKAAEEAVAFAAATAAATAAAAAALEAERTAQEQLAAAEKRRVEAEAAELEAAAQRRQEEEAAVKQEEERQRAAKARASRPSTVAAAAAAATVAAVTAAPTADSAIPATTPAASPVPASAASAVPAAATAAVDPPSQVSADTTDVSVNVPAAAAAAGESPSSSESPDPTSGAAAASAASPPLLSADAAAKPSEHSITIAPEDGKCAEPSAHNKADAATTKPDAMNTEESTKEKAAEEKTPPEKKKCCTIL